jgi:hypothetical protein
VVAVAAYRREHLDRGAPGLQPLDRVREEATGEVAVVAGGRTS